jgi:hypothetical protein
MIQVTWRVALRVVTRLQSALFLPVLLVATSLHLRFRRRRE